MDRIIRNVVLAVATLSGFVATFAASGIVLAMKPLDEEFRLSAVFLTWIPLTYILAAGALLMTAGRLGDIFGRMRVFAIGLVGFTAFSFAAATATSGAWLLATRTAQGLAASLLFATNIALATLSHPPEQRGRALGILTAGVYLGSTAGPFLGGVIIDHLGWRSLFWFVGGVTFITLFLTLWALRKVEWKEPRDAPFDKSGSIVWAAALPALLMGFTFLPSLEGILLVIGGALGLAFFLWWETRASDPVLSVNLLRQNRAFAFSNAAALINYSATFAIIVLMTMYLEYVLGLSEKTAGYVLVSQPLVQVMVSPIAGRMADRIQPRLVAATGQALCVLGLLAFAFLQEDTPLWYVIATLGILGIGFGLFASPVAHIVMGSVEKRDLGTASAILATMRVSGQGISVGIAGLVLALLVGRQEQMQPADYPNLLTGVRITFVIFAGLCVIGLIALLLGRPRSRPRGPVSLQPPEPQPQPEADTP